MEAIDREEWLPLSAPIPAPAPVVAWLAPLWAQTDSFQRAEPFSIPWLPWIAWMAVFLGIFPLIVAYTVWGERKVAARFQDRVGPNRVGPLGLLQSIADLLKLLTKEDLVPSSADRWVHLLAPIVLLTSAMLCLAVIPFGVSSTVKVAPFGMEQPDPARVDGWWYPGLAAVDLPSGLLYIVAASSVATLGIFLAGWGSRNKYSLLGAMRGVAQLVSYEIPQVLALVPVILWAGGMSLSAIFTQQVETGWFIGSPPGILAFLIFLIASIAEVNRAPFDIPEAESEIIAGYHTEYSGMKFGLFFLAEYLGMVVISCLATLLFLGGGMVLPFLRFPLGETPLPTFWANLILVPVFTIKAVMFLFLMFWIRATLPRVRVDRLMAFAWKFLIPLSLANILIAAIWYECVHRPATPAYGLGWAITLPIAVVAVWGSARLFGEGQSSAGETSPSSMRTLEASHS